MAGLIHVRPVGALSKLIGSHVPVKMCRILTSLDVHVQIDTHMHAHNA